MTASIKIQSKRLERREIDFKRNFTTILETLKRNFKKNPLILKKFKNIFLRKLLLVIRRDTFENILKLINKISGGIILKLMSKVYSSEVKAVILISPNFYTNIVLVGISF